MSEANLEEVTAVVERGNALTKSFPVVLPGARVKYDDSTTDGFGTLLRKKPMVESSYLTDEASGKEVYAKKGAVGTVVSIGEDFLAPQDLFCIDQRQRPYMHHAPWSVVVEIDTGGYLITALNERFKVKQQGIPNQKILELYKTFCEKN